MHTLFKFASDQVLQQPTRLASPVRRKGPMAQEPVVVESVMDRPREVTVEAHGDLKLAPTPQNGKNGHHKKRPWAKKQHSEKDSSKDPKAKDAEPIVKPVPYFSLFR